MNKKLFFVLVSALVLTMVFVGCTASKQSPERHETSMYYIHKEEGQYWLTPKNLIEATDNIAIDTAVAHYFPKFASVAEMRQGIISGSYLGDDSLRGQAITKAYLHSLSVYAGTNEDGSIRIVNLDNLYEFTKPSEMEVSYIEWRGCSYRTHLKGEKASADVICYEAEDHYQSSLRKYKDFLTDPKVTVDRQEEDQERGATIYYGYTDVSESKYICYEINVGAKHIYVQESYLLEHYTLENGELQMYWSSTVPQSVKLWGTEDGGYFDGYITGLSERPSVEWISQFGLREYVETEVA